MKIGNGSPLIKIDNLAINGLEGVEGSLGYKVDTIEKHLHNNEKWFGLAGTPDAELHRADRITLLPSPFRADAGDDDWGSWLQVLGSNDTPVKSGMLKFDFHKVLIHGHERNTNMYVMQMASGESADLAAKLVSEDFTELTLVTGGGTSEVGAIDFKDIRCDAGDKVWARIWADGQNTGWLDFYIGIHEYIG